MKKSYLKESEFIFNKHSSKDFDRLLKQFFWAKPSFFTVENLNKFFVQLKQNDYGMQYGRMYNIKMDKKLGANGVSICSLNIKSCLNLIKLNTLNDYKNIESKKYQMIHTYLHECTHSQQFFCAVSHYCRNIKAKNQLENVFCDDYIQNSFQDFLPYEFRLTEIHANMNAINIFVSKLKNNTIPLYMEGLTKLIWYVLFVFKGCNNISTIRELEECDYLSFQKQKFIDYYSKEYNDWNKKKEKFKIKNQFNKEEDINRPEIDFVKLADEFEVLYNRFIENAKYLYLEIMQRYNPTLKTAQNFGYKGEKPPTKDEFFELIKNKNPLYILHNIYRDYYAIHHNSPKKYFAEDFEYLYKENEQ